MYDKSLSNPYNKRLNHKANLDKSIEGAYLFFYGGLLLFRTGSHSDSSFKTAVLSKAIVFIKVSPLTGYLQFLPLHCIVPSRSSTVIAMVTVPKNLITASFLFVQGLTALLYIVRPPYRCSRQPIQDSHV